MNEESLRKMAIQQFLQRRSPVSIYREIGRSKKWFFKWLQRYQSGDPEWYRDRSKAPHTQSHQTPVEMQNLVKNIRTQLEQTPYAQVGVSAIKWQCQGLGVTPPSDRTVNRILKREGLIKKNTLYPQRSALSLFQGPLGMQQYPSGRFGGPRYIKNDGRFFSLNIMDLYSHRVFLHPQRTKDDQAIAHGLIRCWKTLGMPDFLQFDNELAFRGSNRYPRSFGIVLRVCLSLGIEAVFIPIGEPWRNGTIESFNETYDQRFFRVQWFRSYRHLRSQSRNFELHHNTHHRYSYLKGKTPLEVIQQEQFRTMVLPPRFKLPEISNIPDGTISLIRFIRSDQVLDVFGEHFLLPRDLIYTYVRARIVTALHQIQVYAGEELALCLPYELPLSISTEP